jgi:hypothetical protein
LPFEVGVRLHCPVPFASVMVQIFPVPLRPSDTLIVPLGVPVYCAVTVAVTMAICPLVIDAGETESVVVLFALLMVCDSTAEMLVVSLLSPANTAVMKCEPSESEDVLNVAMPEPFSIPAPSVVDPSLKVTASPLPEVMGVPPLLTVAVKVTGWPKADGFTEDVTAVVVAAWLTVRLKLPLLVACVLSPP